MHTSSFEFRRTIAILGILSMLLPLAVDMYLSAIPDIATDFQVPVGYVQFSLTTFMIGFAIGQVVYGTLSDTYGRKSVIVFGVVAFTLFCVLATISPNVEFFVIIRFLHGLAAASAGVVINAVVRDRFSSVELAKTMATISLVSNVAPLLAPLVGGWIHHLWHWRAIFGSLATISGIAIILFIRYIPESLPPDRRQPLRFRTTLSNFRDILLHRNSRLAMYASAASFSGMFVFLVLGSTVYQHEYGIGSEEFGWYFMINILCMMGFNLLNRRLLQYWTMLQLLSFGLAVQLVMGVLMLILVGVQAPHIWLALSVSIYVGTIAFIGANSMAVVLDAFGSTAGAASSVVGFIRFGMAAAIGGVLAVAFTSTGWVMGAAMAACAAFGLWCALRIHTR